MTHSRGDAVRLEMTKWGDRPHWEMDAVFLGSDEHGDWLGLPQGTLLSRPGWVLNTANHQVLLLPPGAFVVTFHGPGGDVQTYVDMSTPPVWDRTVARAVDLDLDVIEELDGTVFVDDEDEFEEHRVRYGYPPDVVAMAESSRDEVYAAVLARTAPFDGSAQPWLDELVGLLG